MLGLETLSDFFTTASSLQIYNLGYSFVCRGCTASRQSPVIDWTSTPSKRGHETSMPLSMFRWMRCEQPIFWKLSLKMFPANDPSAAGTGQPRKCAHHSPKIFPKLVNCARRRIVERFLTLDPCMGMAKTRNTASQTILGRRHRWWNIHKGHDQTLYILSKTPVL